MKEDFSLVGRCERGVGGFSTSYRGTDGVGFFAANVYMGFTAFAYTFGYYVGLFARANFFLRAFF